jgi:ABC-type transport system involved in cytochrome bd biosynthesis fused ATPase/permease subunit
MVGAVVVAAALGVDVVSAQEANTTLTPAALAEITQVEAEIDRIEAQTLERLAAPPHNQVQQDSRAYVANPAGSSFVDSCRSDQRSLATGPTCARPGKPIARG